MVYQEIILNFNNKIVDYLIKTIQEVDKRLKQKLNIKIMYIFLILNIFNRPMKKIMIKNMKNNTMIKKNSMNNENFDFKTIINFESFLFVLINSIFINNIIVSYNFN